MNRLKRTPFKSHKHARTQATDIPQEVKDEVFERDGKCCIWCGSPNGMPEAHYISRNDGGLGIPQNIITLCRIKFGETSCHDLYDQGTKETREEMRRFFKTYLSVRYADWEWSEEKLKYRKGG